VGNKADKQIKEIEDTQEALRESIAEAKDLADKAQRLLQNHKKTIERESDADERTG
jgi:hypothetical protein